MRQGEALTIGSSAAKPPGSPTTQLDELAWLAAHSLDGDGALIVVNQDGHPTPGASFGLPSQDIRPVIELCRQSQAGSKPGQVWAIAPGGKDVLLEHWMTGAGLVTPAGDDLGCLCVLGCQEPSPMQRRVLGLLAELVATHIFQGRSIASMELTSQRAARTERMLHLIADAGSITDALTNMLGELCSHHGAVIGRIWRLTSPGDLMQEISRYNDDGLNADSYYRRPPNAPVTWGNSFTADAIRSNQPRAVVYSQIQQPERYALLQAAIQSGLRCQVSFPVWVGDERFGISFAFGAERLDLDHVVAPL